MRAVLGWLTDAALADSIVGDLEEGRRREGAIWFARAVAGVLGYIAWRRVVERLAGNGGFRRGLGDARHAERALRRRPAFAITAILLLALGIGANTAVFSVVRAVLLRPLPYADVDRLAFVWNGLYTNPGNRHGILTGKHAIDITREATTLQSVAIVKGWQTALDGELDLLLADGAERLRGAQVTPNFFDLLGVRAATGRAFSAADGDARIAVISDALWRRRFSADPGVIGTTVHIAPGRSARNGAAFTIVGVLPPEFRYSYPRETEAYLLLPWSTVKASRALEYQMIAKVKPGVAFSQAQAELTGIARNVSRAFVRLTGKDLDTFLSQTAMLVEPVAVHLEAEVRPGLLLIVGVAALVLLIACVNLALLLIARTVDRRGELGLQAALGAGTRRIVRQLTLESALLSAAGGICGIAITAAAMPLIRGLMPPIVPRVDQIGIDPLVLAFAAGLMIVTTVACGVAPALIVLRRDLIDEVRRSGVTYSGDRAVIASRRAIVAVQVAFVVLLLVGSGLLLRSFWRLQNVDLGFEAGQVVTMEIRLLNPKYREPGARIAFHEDALTRIRAVPGVVRAGFTTAVPMRGVDFTNVVGPPGGKARPGNARTVDPEYFHVMRVPLKAGRGFTADDTASSEPVAIVSESYGGLHFGSSSPLGQFLDMGGARPTRIVGVVGDMRYADATRSAAPAFYLPRVQHAPELICLVAEPQPGMAAAVVDGIRQAVKGIDPEQPVQGITTIRQIVSESTADRRFYAVATGAFAAVALLLAIAGVFGVVARTVSERRRELAIRVALGADPRRLRRLVFGYGLIPASIGTIAGLATAFGLSRFLRSLLFEIAPTDAPTFAATAAIVIAVTAAACYLPARRTLRMPPMSVLKSE